MSLMWEKILPLPLFRTASDRKLGGAWEQGYLGLSFEFHLLTYQLYLLAHLLSIEVSFDSAEVNKTIESNGLTWV